MSTQLTAPSTTTVASSRAQRRIPRLLSFHVVLGAFIIILVFLLIRQNTADPDLWWHLKTAEYVLTHHTFPFQDAYSITARGQAWVPHEWLGEMLFYAGYKAAGLRGVWCVSFVLCSMIFIGVFYLCYRVSDDIKNSMLVTILGVLLGKISFGPRTLLLGWLFLVVLLLVLEQLRRGKTALLWVVPALFVLWVNSHGSWILGLAIFGMFVACGCFEYSWAKIDSIPYSRRHLRKLLVVAVLSLAAVFLNPAGYRIVLYPFDFRFKQPVNVSSVEEWQSINFHQGNGLLLLAVIFCVIAVMLFSRVRWNLQELALLLVALYMSATYVRMLFLAGILIPPILARRIKLFAEYDPDAENKYMNAGVLLACALVVVAAIPKTSQLQNDVSKFFPIEAVEHIKAHPIEGSLFNDYVWGGYLIWKDVPVFIDGRADIYDHAGVFAEYMHAINLEDSFGVFDRYRVERALLAPKTPIAYLLGHSPEWSVEYRDEKSVVFRRVRPALQ